MMSTLNNAMTVSTQRFLTYELGCADPVRMKRTFSVCMTIFILLALLVLIFGETVGLWFVNTQLVIPPDRLKAANWIYQFSIISCIISLLSNPYNATIVAHEKMNVYAYVGILEVLLKLVIVFLLALFPFDNLIVYGFLVCLTTFIVTILYRFYCVRHFSEAKFQICFDKQLFKEIGVYSGWNLFGALSGIAKGEGLNILINVFFGPAVNAARGIAYQVNNAVASFFSNFYMAVRPQITKYYARKELQNMFDLVFRSSKMAFILIMLISLPLIIEAPYVINLWLGQTPDYVIPFVRLILIITVVDSMSTPLMTAIHATGNIKVYQISVGLIMMMTLPLSYIALKLGASPISVFVISLFLSFISLFVRLGITSKQLQFPFWSYVKEVVLKAIITIVISSIIPIALHNSLVNNTFITLVIVTIFSIVAFLIVSYLLYLNKKEKAYIRNLVLSKLKRS